MANPTTNFGWVMPTSTDLVTDLPADFAVFGQGVDTTMADLKGGTTGQVLSKATNADMDFTWVAQDDSNAIQNAIVDAKGDLIAASAADTPARLAVGTNGQILTADSTTATGLKWAAAAGGNTNPAFRAFRSTTSQSITTNVRTKVQFNGESFDTNSCFDSSSNYRFTPTSAGYYQMNVILSVGGTCSRAQREMYSSTLGSVRISDNSSAEPSILGGTDLLYCNGSTDYVEIYVTLTGTSLNITQGYDYTYFSGVWVRN
jgi:hypothetical protein